MVSDNRNFVTLNSIQRLLYIGKTNSIERRMYEHKQAINDGFAKRYNLKMLVHSEYFQYVNDAIRREKQLKNWKRQWKIDLIEMENPNWEDLSKDWF